MKKQEIKNLKVGDIVKNCIGDREQVVAIESGKYGKLYTLKWILENGQLTSGEELLVASHLRNYYKISL